MVKSESSITYRTKTQIANDELSGGGFNRVCGLYLMETDAELEALRTSVQRGRPFVSEPRQMRTAKKMGLESIFRPRGRPRKTKAS